MKKILPVLLVILVFPAIFQFFMPGFFVSDDGEWMVIRFSSFYDELRQFQIPVRFLNRLNNSYGYPVATFLYPGFMYIASVFKLLGMGFMASVKGVMVVSILSAFIGTYLFLKNHFSQRAAIVGALLYIYNPYFLWDIYKRGSVGEVLAMGVLPFILYFIDTEKRIIAALLTGFLIISHNTLALLFLPFIAVYFIVNQLSKRTDFKVTAIRSSVYLLVALGVSAFFWVPAMYELPLTVFTNTGVSSFSEYFISDFTLIGAVNTAILVASLLYVAIKRKYSLVLYLMISISLLSLFFSYGISGFLWTHEGLGKFVQFPFRFMSLFAVGISYLGAFLFSRVKQYITIFTVLGIAFIIVAGIPFISQVQHKDVSDDYYSTNVDTTTVKNEYMPHWVNTLPDSIPSQKIERIDENTVQINTIYWPGHTVLVNGEEVSVDYSNDQGIMRISTDSEIENIAVVFKETRYRMISDIVSLVSIFIAGFLFFKKTTYV